MPYKLGKKPPKRDPRTPKLEKYLRRGIVPAHLLEPHVLFVGAQGRYPQVTSLTHVSGTGTVRGTDTLTAVLTVNGSPLAGEVVYFQFPDQQPRQALFHAYTNRSGVAVVTGIPAPDTRGTSGSWPPTGAAGGTRHVKPSAPSS